MSTSDTRFFGAHKYTAYNLMLARWLSCHSSNDTKFCYVTMGGTELYDIVNFAWAIQNRFQHAVSYEEDPKRFKHAQSTAKRLSEQGLNIELIQGDLFDYRRSEEYNHIFFVDLEGTCTPGQYSRAFRQWFDSDTIQPGDMLLITSYLGRNAGWEKTLDPYEGEFRSLKTSTLEEKKRVYKALHPAFVVNRAMSDTGIDTELMMTCLGHVKYYDTSPMGLYCLTFQEGSTKFRDLISSIPTFDIVTRSYSMLFG